MSDLPYAACLALAGCLLLGASTASHWGRFAANREHLRRGVQVAGWASLVASAFGFASQFGWEVGTAWFVLWLTIGTLAATLWASWRAREAAWAGAALAGVALAAWVV